MEAQAVFDARARGQLRHRQGQPGRRQRRLPPRGLRGRSSARRSRRAPSRSSARPTPTTGIRRSPRPTMEQVLTAENNDDRRRALRERRHGRRRRRRPRGPGPGRSDPGVRPGRRPGRTQPRRARHADGRRLEGLPRARHGRRRSRRSRCARTPTPTAVAGTAPFTTPGGIDITLDPARRRSRSPRTTSTSCSTPAGSTRPPSARASRPVRSLPAPERCPTHVCRTCPRPSDSVGARLFTSRPRFDRCRREGVTMTELRAAEQERLKHRRARWPPRSEDRTILALGGRRRPRSTRAWWAWSSRWRSSGSRSTSCPAATS